MSASVKKSFSWLWLATLLTATIGVGVQQIYCQCLNKTTTALCAPVQIVEQDGCCQQKVQPEPAACCAKKPVVAKNAQGCTKKSTQVFQLKTEFLVDHHPVEKSFDFPLWINDFPMLRRMSRSVICDATIFRQALPPPPLSGRDLCLRHQLALC